MIAIRDIAHVRYQAPDLDAMERFLIDFGLHRSARTDTALYMRGYGEAHHVHITERGTSIRPIGFGLYAQRMGDLEELSRRFNVPLELSTEPGGGHRVRVVDPAGFAVDVIHGQATLPSLAHRNPIDVNAAGRRLRVGRSVRVSTGPSTVMRLGHIILLVPEFKQCLDFYRDNFNLRASDSYFAGAPENIIASFLHCGLGTNYTDHHTIALVSTQDGIARFDHCAFEVLDLDDVMQGNAHLRTKGYTHSWGVGRHVQGSQIFDYWRDPFGNKIEHWTDGDLVNDESPVGIAPMSGDELKQWAPPLNPDFFA